MDYFDRVLARTKDAAPKGAPFFRGDGKYQLPGRYSQDVAGTQLRRKRQRRREDLLIAYHVTAIETILAWPYDEKGAVRDATP